MSSCLTVAEFLQMTGVEFTTFGAASTGTVTVAGVPGAPGGTITIGGVVLTSVAGARTPGSDDFSLASGTVTGVAADIVAAINDSANSFTSTVTAAIQTAGLAIVSLTSVATGYYSLLPIATSDATNFVLSHSTLEGGDEQLTYVIDGTCLMLGDCWTTKKIYAHAYLAAHFATVQGGGETGAVASKTIDKISTSYATTPPSDPDLGSTKWGRLYLALRKSVTILPVSGRSDEMLVGVVGRWW